MKIVCIGRNYADHAAELNNEIPTDPVIFIKPDTALLKDNSPFYIPNFTNNVHYELELIVKINKMGKHIPLHLAKNYYSHISLGIDFTARDLQDELKSKGLPWERAKGFDYSAAIGEFVELNKNIQTFNFNLKKNGNTVQTGNTAHMLFNVDAIISYVSLYFTLKVGDIIFTGTPAGVGKIEPGDILEGFLENQKLITCSIF